MKIRTLHFLYIVIFFLVFAIGCGQPRKNRHEITERSLPEAVACDTTVRMNPVAEEYDFDIAGLVYSDSGVICVSDLDSFAFHVLDPVSLKETKKFGKRGEGPGEYLEPELVVPLSGRMMVADCWRHHIIEEKDTIKYGSDAINMAGEISGSLLGYTVLGENGYVFKIYDMENEMTRDSIDCSVISPDVKDSPLFWSSNGKHIVAAFLKANIMLIAGLEQGAIKGLTVLRGGLDGHEFAYSCVVCLDDRFIVLSQEDVDFKTGTGSSKIKAFDYDGKALSCIDTGMVGYRFTYDRKNKRVIMASNDDLLYTFRF